MDMRCQIAALLSVAIGALSLCGCGSGYKLETTTVRGKVVLDGKPLGRGTVIFTPQFGRAATGPIQSDGSYTLGTYKPGDGAVLGKHLVSVISREELPNADPLSMQVGPSLIPVYYGDSGKSGLSYEVKSDGPNVYDIQLSSSAKPAQP